MFQFVFDRATEGTGFSSRIFERVRRVLIRYGDPVVRYDVGGRPLLLNMSHQLRLYRNLFPTYSDNLSRLAGAVRRRFGFLRMTDVGANVGDSYFLVRPQHNDECLLIEGDAHYFELLSRNTKNAGGVTLVLALLSDRPSETHDVLSSTGGTARIVKGAAGGQKLAYKTLDQVISENPSFRTTNLLKTDVDGYDHKVLLGAQDLIREARPSIFFEHHPGLLAASGEDETRIFTALGRAGYSSFIFYDNFGYLHGTVSATDLKQLTDLMFYARQRKDFYYDNCCIHDAQEAFRKEFLEEEKAFFRANVV